MSRDSQRRHLSTVEANAGSVKPIRRLRVVRFSRRAGESPSFSNFSGIFFRVGQKPRDANFSISGPSSMQTIWGLLFRLWLFHGDIRSSNTRSAPPRDEEGESRREQIGDSSIFVKRDFII